jgi:predicted dehydrogenase
MKQIRLGIIGCGGFVQYHLRPMAKDVPEFKIVALCDIIRGHAEHHRKLYCPRRRVPIYLDHREMLKKEKLDAVIVSTPHTLHFQHAYNALGAGCHVMTEKPMVTSSVHARRLVARAEKKKLNLQIAIQGTYTDTFAYARQVIAEETFGELQLVTGVLAQGWRDGTMGRWRQDPKFSGGGQLYDSCAHVLSAMMFLVNSPVREVFCLADNKGTKVDINAVTCMKFANGAMANVTSGGNCRSWKSHLTLQCKDAKIEISPHGGDFNINGGGLEKDIKKPPRGWKVPTVSPSRNFADVILGKARPRCGGDVGILLADLMDAIYESIETGKLIKLKA